MGTKTKRPLLIDVLRRNSLTVAPRDATIARVYPEVFDDFDVQAWAALAAKLEISLMCVGKAPARDGAQSTTIFDDASDVVLEQAS